MKYRLLLILCSLFLIQCKKDVGFDWESTYSERSLIVVTTSLPNECILSPHILHYRKITFYKTYEDMRSKTDSIGYLNTSLSRGNEAKSVKLKNVMYDSVYIRVMSYSDCWVASYFLDNVVIMAPNTGETTITLGENNLVLEWIND
jgi:hypothetical protein